ncbi:DUF2325 domain-containing protein [Thermodesulfovibrio sp. 3907-1M]|uniref:DUF2325 domain-containing protein n=1 Tax=Thermodesulfovibrio autotrophicus TaxID=3118333 RepID=A0AAU8GY10_9BACT
MSVLLIGGMDRLKSHYLKEASQRGINLKLFTKPCKEVTRKIGKVDAIVVFTNKVSHSIRDDVINFARAKGIPFFMCHSCGLCTLRKYFDDLKKLNQKGGLA